MFVYWKVPGPWPSYYTCSLSVLTAMKVCVDVNEHGQLHMPQATVGQSFRRLNERHSGNPAGLRNTLSAYRS